MYTCRHMLVGILNPYLVHTIPCDCVVLRTQGRVAPYTHNGVSIGPQRVWLSDRQSPGLREWRYMQKL